MNHEENTPLTITKIEKQPKRRQRYNIYINDQYAFSIHEDVLIKHSLAQGKIIDEEQQHYISIDEERHQTYHQAVRFLSRKARSSKELERKLLAKNYKQEAIDWAIAKLSEQGYIDDQQFANMLTEQRVLMNAKGKRWIQQELAAKGLSQHHIDEAIAQIDEQTEANQAYEIAKKRWDRFADHKPLDRKRKVNDLLLRRGYSYSIVREVLNRLNDDHNDWMLSDDYD